MRGFRFAVLSRGIKYYSGSRVRTANQSAWTSWSYAMLKEEFIKQVAYFEIGLSLRIEKNKVKEEVDSPLGMLGHWICKGRDWLIEIAALLPDVD